MTGGPMFPGRMANEMPSRSHLRDLLRGVIKQERRADGSMLAERADGSRVLFDAATLEYLESEAPPPNQQQLDAMLSRARSARVTMATPRGDHVDRELLLEIRDPSEVSSLGATLRISPEPCGHCLCHGNPRLTFFDEREFPLAEISLHHGTSIRWRAWCDDARLLNGRASLEWLANKGVRAPLDELEAELRDTEALLAAWHQWHEATPGCLQPLLEPYRQLMGQAVVVPSPSSTVRMSPESLSVPSGMSPEYFAEVARTFDHVYPNAREQARVLYAWLGRGCARWSGFPVYEQVAECLLLRLSLEDLLLGFYESDPRETLEGAARFFASWAFNAYRGEELARIPEGLRQRMRDHAMQSADADRLARVRAAFGS